jgi:hypothetical protein
LDDRTDHDGLDVDLGVKSVEAETTPAQVREFDSDE